MTIYNVIDNHHAYVSSENGTDVHWTILSGASILQGGSPFFIPDFAKRFEARLSMAVRICRLGKNIAPRFAHRYMDAAAPCVSFTAADLLESLRAHGLPWTGAVNFDRSAAFGKYVPADIDAMENAEVRLDLYADAKEEVETRWSPSTLRIPIREVISHISRDNTIKTGDVILVGTDAEGPAVEIGQHAILSFNGTTSVKFNIR